MRLSITQILVVLIILTLLVLGFTNAFAGWNMTNAQQAAFVLLLVAATLWISEIIPLFATSFVILALSLTWILRTCLSADMEVSKTTFLAPFFSDIILLFLGGFVLSSAMHKYSWDESTLR